MSCTKMKTNTTKVKQDSNIEQNKNGYVRKNGHVIQSKINQADKWKDDYHEYYEECSLIFAVITYLNYAILSLVGYIRDYLCALGLDSVIHTSREPKIEGFVQLFQSWESFYTRHLYRRIRDCWNRPVAGAPGAEIDLLDRVSPDYGWNFELTGTTTRVLNFGSYNYLGFAESKGPCADAVEETTKKYGVGVCASRMEMGYTVLHKELDELIARFVGVDDAITVPMGFATNSMNLPVIFGKGCLILSDELNHASLCLGAKLSGATIRVFKHNDMVNLEEHLRTAVIDGQPRTHRPWRKILIIVEGVYSMEGSIVQLPDIIRLKKKYKAYIFLDEAHSIGALGPHGRGVVDYFGLNPRDVDILMGTFTKSFGSAGGYLAGTKSFINYIRLNSHAQIYSCSMSAPVIQQILSSTRIIMGEDGTDMGKRRIAQLKWNAVYFRQKLFEKGFVIYGNRDSPVVPLLLYWSSNLAGFSRETLKRGLATVVVGFPATSLLTGRARFCMSASHTKEMLDKAVDIVDDVGYRMYAKYSRRPPPPIEAGPQPCFDHLD